MTSAPTPPGTEPQSRLPKRKIERTIRQVKNTGTLRMAYSWSPKMSSGRTVNWWKMIGWCR